MPFVVREGVRLYWKLAGVDDRPPLVLLNSIGTDMDLWDATLPHLLPAFRVLRLDMRGHGASDAPGGDYSLAMLAQDVAAVMDAANIDRAAVAGVSLGGMIAMQLALDHPGKVSALALICTSATMDSAAWAARVDKVRAGGTAAIADLAMQRFLSAAFVSEHPEVAATVRRGLLDMADTGYAGAAAAIRDMALLDRLPALARPVLVLAGDRDLSTPFAGHGEHIVAAIAGAQAVLLACAHLAPLEAPLDLAKALRGFPPIAIGASLEGH